MAAYVSPDPTTIAHTDIDPVWGAGGVQANLKEVELCAEV